MDDLKLRELADRLDKSAIKDAEHAVNNAVCAERAYSMFRLANELRARATLSDNTRL